MLFRQKTEKSKRSSIETVAQTLSTRIISSVSMLTPFIGSDLHVLVENALCPQNARSNCGVDVFGWPLFRDSITNIRRKQIDPTANNTHALDASVCSEEDSEWGICVGDSRHIYNTFAAVNKDITKRRKQNSADILVQSSAASDGSTTSASDLTSGEIMSEQMAKTLCYSYSGSIIRLMCRSLLTAGRFMCGATMMAVIMQSLGAASASSVSSWVQNCVFSVSCSHPSPIAHLQPTDPHSSSPYNERTYVALFKKSPLFLILRALGFSSKDQLKTSSSLHSPINATFGKSMSHSFSDIELRKLCEKEMYVSYSSNADDGGCLVNTPCFSGRDVSDAPHREGSVSDSSAADEITSSPRTGYTAVPLHGRASSKFAIPKLISRGRLSTESLLRGLAAAALIVGAIDIVVVSVCTICTINFHIINRHDSIFYD